MSPVRVQILTIGDELLAGDIVDTNETFFAQHCRELGMEVRQSRAVRDRLDEIVESLREIASRSETQRVDVCLISGGLGPTSDDLTTAAVAQALGVALERSSVAIAHLEYFFAARGRAMTPNNLKQADFPKGAEPLANPVGTALGFVAEAGPDLWLAVMPGVPREMKPMFVDEVVPRLRARFGARLGGHARRTYRTMGVGESALAQEIADVLTPQALRKRGIERDILVHYRAHPPEVLLTLEAVPWTGASACEISSLWQALDSIVREKIGEYVYAIGEAELPQQIHQLLLAHGQTVAVAESCTGGWVGKLLTEEAGASTYFVGGVTVYDNRLKEKLLEVPASLLAREGAVSDACAQSMAQGVRNKLGATWNIAVTGIAGPGGGSAEKPVGTVHLAVCGPSGLLVRQVRLPGDRERVRQSAARWALRLLRDALGAETPWLT